MPPIRPQQISSERYHQALDEIVRRLPDDARTLPSLPLSQSNKEDLLRSFFKRLTKMGDWLLHQLGFDINAPAISISDTTVLTFFIIAVALGLGVVLWPLIRFKRRKETVDPPTYVSRGREDLEQRLNAALAVCDFAGAARIRWRIFQHDLRLPLSVTPNIFAIRHPNLGLEPMQFYTTMFGGQNETVGAFEECQRQLTRIEETYGTTHDEERT